MNKYEEIFYFLRECPQLNNLWSIAATEEAGINVVIPAGSSQVFEYNEKLDVYGGYECEIVPYPSIYEDFQINCYKVYDPQDSSAPNGNVNVLSLNDAQLICDWIMKQDQLGNLPNITGKKVVSIECMPSNPQIRGVDTARGFICYFITFRIRYVNDYKGRSIEYDGD